MSAVAETVEEVGAPVSDGLNLVDDQHPWLGLDSFSEETRQYFHGREEEIAELARRVQRKTLAILFGQSGLGKTSILRAGIVPRLRREGYCPVYVRIDYARESPPPSQQIKQAIFRATEGAGRWTRPGTAVPGESLWEFLHHRDDYLVDNEGRELTPLLIFDQFEEIFTLGQDDDFGRARAAEFIEDLADLVENRPPKALEMMLESEESIVERYDFERADYRILIALREDYLAHLEGLKGAMPSITQNRMRLARMTGQQALVAVMKPGGRLVTEEVAESIVRFVAGGAELRNAEVEPSLLSLVCRELNNARVAQGRAEISADLLAGSRETILHEFYERALVDQPEGVRHFIEDEMLTESGFRESLAEERVLRAFTAAGAATGALASLVNRRLLRIEERLDMRRVELTHDVLCKVVSESRDLRHEREAKEEAERQLEGQKAREIATRKALLRARQIAFGCTVLAVIAVGASIFGYVNMKRAQETRTQAEGARSEAEKLIVYLLDDFYLELEPVGRLDIVADLSRRALAYYDALAPGLRTNETERNRALAMVRLGYVLRYQGNIKEAAKTLDEANSNLERLRAQGDSSEVTAIGLALGLSARARVQDNSFRDNDALLMATKSAQVLEPLMKSPSPSVRLRRAEGQVKNYLGFVQMRLAKEGEGAKSLEEALAAYRSIDELRMNDLASAAAYAESSSWLVEAYGRQGRLDDARRVAEEAIPIAKAVLDKRPGHMAATRAKALLNSGLAQGEIERFRMRDALAYSEQSALDWESFLKLDSGNTVAWNNLGANRLRAGGILGDMGRPSDGLAMLRSALQVERGLGASGVQFAQGLMFIGGWLAIVEADLAIKPEKPVPDYRRIGEAAARGVPAGSFQHLFLTGTPESWDLRVAVVAQDYEMARRRAPALLAKMQAVKPSNDSEKRVLDTGFTFVYHTYALALYNLGDFAGAEKAALSAIAHRKLVPVADVGDRLEVSEQQVLLAMALARQGRHEEARKVAEAELKLHREWSAMGNEHLGQRFGLAETLYAMALASPGAATPYLREAGAVVDAFPADMKRRKSVAQLRGRISGSR